MKTTPPNNIGKQRSFITLGALACLGAALLLSGCEPKKTVGDPETPHLVWNGKARGVVVCSAPAGSPQRNAVDQFVRLVERSTGARVPVISSDEEAALPPEKFRLFVGDSPQASAAGLSEESLPEETYRILSRGNALYVSGREDANPKSNAPASRPTLWALNRLLEDGLGIRWLWPGELGTYVPQRKDFPLAVQDVTYQPELMIRSLRMRTSNKTHLASSDPEVDARLKREALLWAENHQCGRRGNITMHHAFTNWWEKYSQDHPDYFAELRPGMKQPHPKPDRVKLRLSNPAVIEQIAAEYEAEGKPEYWNVCPNDSASFDTSEATRAWDIPTNQPIEKILSGKANLTARYVEFWNRLYERLTQINPDVKLVSFAYSAYRQQPPAERPLKAKAVLGVVNSFDDYDAWKGWSATGASLLLRPNWWYLGEDAPYLPLEKTERYLKFAWKNGMIGMDMDSIRGYWATQGINYYLGARLMTQPELTLDEILTDYTAAFGGGADKIREYLTYWRKLTDEYNYPMIRHDSPESQGRYGDLVRKGKVPVSILSGSKPALIYLYSDEVLSPAYRLLDEAAAAIDPADSEARQRVEFLRRGLRSLEATREQIARGIQLDKNKKSTPEEAAAFTKGAKDLRRLRDELSTDHAIWGESSAYREHKHKIPVWPEYIKNSKVNTDGEL